MGPLVVGCCFALGYGITDRVLTLQTNAEDPAPQAFAPLVFPGDSLQEIRARFSDDDPELQVDLTALEAAEAASRPPTPEVKTTTKPDVALQTANPPRCLIWQVCEDSTWPLPVCIWTPGSADMRRYWRDRHRHGPANRGELLNLIYDIRARGVRRGTIGRQSCCGGTCERRRAKLRCSE